MGTDVKVWSLKKLRHVGWAKARSAVPTKPLREARMSRYRRLKMESGAFFFALALAGRGSDLLVRHIERPLAGNRRGCPQQVWA
jgi:hypothetical protein